MLYMSYGQGFQDTEACFSGQKKWYVPKHWDPLAPQLYSLSIQFLPYNNTSEPKTACTSSDKFAILTRCPITKHFRNWQEDWNATEIQFKMTMNTPEGWSSELVDGFWQQLILFLYLYCSCVHLWCYWCGDIVIQGVYLSVEIKPGHLGVSFVCLCAMGVLQSCKCPIINSSWP